VELRYKQSKGKLLDTKRENVMANKKEFDKLQFEDLCGIFCTKDEICAIFRCDEKTLTRWCKDNYGVGFSDIYKTYSSDGKMSLRREQMNVAKRGNPTMLIWMGKQHLDQTDKQHIETDTTDKLQELVNAMNGSAEKDIG